MSILSAMYTGQSGLDAQSDAMGVTGDNVANSNTVGFKSSRGTFGDLLGHTLVGAGGRMSAVGLGVRYEGVRQLHTQGALMNTGLGTDLAVDGNGFFVVRGSHAGATGNWYTRAGQFSLANDGRLVNPEGLAVQGYTADDTGAVGSALGDLQIGGRTMPARESSALNVTASLNALAPVADPAVPFDPTVAASYDAQGTMTVHDALGTAHQVTVYFRKTGDNAWEWHAMAKGDELVGGAPGTLVEGASGTLTFTNGESPVSTTNPPGTWNFVGGTAGQAIAMDFTGSRATSMNDADKKGTAFGEGDGHAAGDLSGINITPDGVITGTFSNGRQLSLGQVAMADFASPDGLQRKGSNLFGESPDSGTARVGAPGTGSRGSVMSGALEQSNVDLTREFVDLIAFQRGFQASSRTVTTADEMLQEVMNLKR